jgi:phosphatidylethanolamine/phosphatidyl-N-methylethanolamine N-methyltransferase
MINKIRNISAFKFLIAYLKSPFTVGSLHPSSSHLARALASQLSRLESVDIIQLGGGTGAITRYLPDNRLTVVEIDSILVKHLKLKFPHLKVIGSCGIDFLKSTTKPIGCIINIPLINNPQEQILLEQLSFLYKSEVLRWCIIYTYGNKSPLAKVGFRNEYRVKKVWKNLPPATVWSYY